MTQNARARMKTVSEINALYDVLLAFEIACPLPTMQDVRLWQDAHPIYVQEILDHAAGIAEAILDGSLMDEPKPDDGDEFFVGRTLEIASRRGPSRRGHPIPCGGQGSHMGDELTSR